MCNKLRVNTCHKHHTRWYNSIIVIIIKRNIESIVSKLYIGKSKIIKLSIKLYYYVILYSNKKKT